MEPYNETQRFNQWWLKVILAIPLFEVLAFMITSYQDSGSVHSSSAWSLFIIMCTSLLLWGMKLTTQIDSDGISYRFFPFHMKSKQISWGDIETAYIREYSPLGEYGGWGIRRSLKNGKAYNVKGRFGLQLHLKNGKKILIGTSDNRKLDSYLQDIKQRYTIPAIQ